MSKAALARVVAEEPERTLPLAKVTQARVWPCHRYQVTISEPYRAEEQAEAPLVAREVRLARLAVLVLAALAEWASLHLR